MTQQYAIGVDLGGTTVKTALIDAHGSIVAQSKLPTRAQENPAAVLEQIVHSINDVMLKAPGKKIAGIGVAAAGIIQNPGGIVKSPPNFKGWDVVPLGTELEKKFNVRIEVDNDANVAAVAEAKFGAGIDYPNFLFIIWGTGVGGGIIMNGKIYQGPYGGAGEVGHISIDYKGLPCNCGGTGCIEAYIGQRYLSKRTVERITSTAGSKIVEYAGGDPTKIEPIHISRAAEAGDPLAKEVLTEAGTLLGVALAGVMNTIDFRVTIIGGGVSAVGDFVYDAIHASTVKNVQKPFREGIRIIRAKLGNDAGVLGAAGMVL